MAKQPQHELCEHRRETPYGTAVDYNTASGDRLWTEYVELTPTRRIMFSWRGVVAVCVLAGTIAWLVW